VAVVVAGALGWVSNAMADTPPSSAVAGPVYPLPGYTIAQSHGGSSCAHTGSIETGNLTWSFGSNPSTTAPETGSSCADTGTPPAFDPTRFQALYWGLDLTASNKNQVTVSCAGPQCNAITTNSGPMVYDSTDPNSKPANGVLVYKGSTDSLDKLTLTFKDGSGNPVALTDASTVGSFANANVNASKLGFVVAVTQAVTNFSVTAAYSVHGASPAGACTFDCRSQTDITGGFYYADLPPAATIKADPSPVANHTTTTFSVDSFTDPYAADDGAATPTYAWDLAGGTTYADGATSSVQSSYGPGDHTVALKVTDADGVSTRVEDPFTIANQNPTGSIAVVSPGTDPPTNHVATTFRATVSDPDQGNDASCAAPTYSWDLSGGTTYGQDPGADATTTFAAGPHKVAILITDCDGATQRIEKTFTVANAAPTGSIMMTPDPALNHQQITFTATNVADPDQGTDTTACPNPTYGWDLTGGTTYTTSPNAPVTETLGPGTYTVALGITDCDGTTTPVTKTFTITDANPSVAFSCLPAKPFAKQAVTCTASDSDPDAAPGDPPLTEAWTVGITHHTGHTFTFKQPAGSHTVSLTVTDRDNGHTTVAHTLVFTKPTARVVITPRQRLATALSHGIKATFKTNEAFSSTLSLKVTKATSKAGKPITVSGVVATAKPAATRAGSVAFTITLSPTAKSKLAQAKTVTFSLAGAARDKFGNAVPIHVNFTLS
jgi:hypothetical protein